METDQPKKKAAKIDAGEKEKKKTKKSRRCRMAMVWRTGDVDGDVAWELLWQRKPSVARDRSR